MSSLADKLKAARASLNWSQAELAKRAGLSQRSITAYEHENIIPRGNTVHKLVRTPGVSFDYLMHDEETDPQANKELDVFDIVARDQYDNSGTIDVKSLLKRTKALFASRYLSQEAKYASFQSLMIAYVTSKLEAQKVARWNEPNSW